MQRIQERWCCQIKTLLCFFNYDGMIVSIQRHIVDALRDMDIEVKECHISQLKEVSESYQPICTIIFHPNKEVYAHLDTLRNLHGHSVVWDFESPYESDIIFDLMNIVYHSFTSDENTAKDLQRKYPDRHIFYVPHACDPKVHHPMDITYEYRSDILFVGNAYPSRIQWFRDHEKEYKGQMVTLIGVGYKGLDGYQNQRLIHGHISEPEMVKYINGAKLVLNLHRLNSDLDMANSRNIQPSSFNNRFYEVAACNVPQLVVGRGRTQIFKPDDYKFFAEDNSYKKRIRDFYLDLIK